MFKKTLMAFLTVAIILSTAAGNAVSVSASDKNGTVQLETENVAASDSDQKETTTVSMYRLYNPNSGEHFYTKDVVERNHLAEIGWKYEGIGWYAPFNSEDGIPVYRLYNKNGGEHHYTVNAAERRYLMNLGWNDEGIGWYSYEEKSSTGAKRMPKSGAAPLYRQYNLNAFSNNHNYTLSRNENDYLIGLGWRSEGIGWYGVKQKSYLTNEEKPNIEKVTASLQNPDSYYVMNSWDKIGYSSKIFGKDDNTVWIIVNGDILPLNLDDTENDGYFDGSMELYATDLNIGDHCKNLILVTNGDDGICRFYIMAYGEEIMPSLLFSTDMFEGSALDYFERGEAVYGDGKLYLMDSERFRSDPDGQPCFRTYVYVDGENFNNGTSNHEEVFHYKKDTDEYIRGCRLLLSKEIYYTDDDGLSGYFPEGSTLTIIGHRYIEAIGHDELHVRLGKTEGWINIDGERIANFHGFA